MCSYISMPFPEMFLYDPRPKRKKTTFKTKFFNSLHTYKLMCNLNIQKEMYLNEERQCGYLKNDSFFIFSLMNAHTERLFWWELVAFSSFLLWIQKRTESEIWIKSVTNTKILKHTLTLLLDCVNAAGILPTQV